jgi:hypothetical protein
MFNVVDKVMLSNKLDRRTNRFTYIDYGTVYTVKMVTGYNSVLLEESRKEFFYEGRDFELVFRGCENVTDFFD